jgi:uncharacterized protein with HEPN domain
MDEDVYEYFGLDLEIIWAIIEQPLPVLTWHQLFLRDRLFHHMLPFTHQS